MGFFSGIRRIQKGAKKRDEAHQENNEKHEEGTPRQNKRQCIHIDPVTKQPKHPEGH
jgi:hypothetical protein